jgi:hypothetical protein
MREPCLIHECHAAAAGVIEVSNAGAIWQSQTSSLAHCMT